MASSDGSRRIAVGDVRDGRVRIRVYAGRVELGHTVGDHIRVRWTVPSPPVGRPRSPRIALGSGGLRIRCRKARLRIDLPSAMTVSVRLRRGQITSWGCDCVLDLVAAGAGSVACRELRSPSADVRAARVSLHFADVPKRVRVRSERAVIALPGGPYLVDAPAGAEVTVPLATDRVEGLPVVRVTGDDVRVLAAGAPMSLTSDPADS